VIVGRTMDDFTAALDLWATMARDFISTHASDVAVAVRDGAKERALWEALLARQRDEQARVAAAKNAHLNGNVKKEKGRSRKYKSRKDSSSTPEPPPPPPPLTRWQSLVARFSTAHAATKQRIGGFVFDMSFGAVVVGIAALIFFSDVRTRFDATISPNVHFTDPSTWPIALSALAQLSAPQLLLLMGVCVYVLRVNRSIADLHVTVRQLAAAQVEQTTAAQESVFQLRELVRLHTDASAAAAAHQAAVTAPLHTRLMQRMTHARRPTRSNVQLHSSASGAYDRCRSAANGHHASVVIGLAHTHTSPIPVHVNPHPVNLTTHERSSAVAPHSHTNVSSQSDIRSRRNSLSGNGMGADTGHRGSIVLSRRGT
jgi:hypothetical protein